MIRKSLFSIRLLSIVVALMLLGPVFAAGEDVETQVEQARLRQVVDRTQQAYVFIGGGSGSIISADGYVLTNNHVAGSAKVWKVKTAAGKSYTADLLGAAPLTDLAILKIRGDRKNLPFLPLGDSDQLAVGEEVIAIGNPFAIGNADHIPTVTLGIVSAVGISGPNAGEVIVTDTPINPGNSGGPLINKAGEQVGVNYAQMPSRFGIRINSGNGYSVTSNQVKRFVDALKKAKGGTVGIGSINGVKFAEQPEDQVVVREVEPESPAGRAGLQAGDRIVKVGPWAALNPGQLIALAARFPSGASSQLVVQRGKDKLEFPIALAEPEKVGLGVVLESASKNSLLIERVVPGGPAAKAGVRRGDTIRGLGTVALPTRQAMATLLGNGRAGMKVPVTLSRGGQQVVVTVELAGQSELARLVRVAATQPEIEPTTQPDHAATTGPHTQPELSPLDPNPGEP
ncbi:MAG: trypsin-like peptidase domain-containing protein [Phycisphaerae bacterium]|nr:trypsin-like peptidase domain-containing protein [Phycisphaerae bacterium]